MVLVFRRIGWKSLNLLLSKPLTSIPWWSGPWLEMSVSCRFFWGPNRHDTTTCRRQCQRHKKSCRRHRTRVATRRPCRCRVVSDEYPTCLRRVGEKQLIVVLRYVKYITDNTTTPTGERPPPPAARILRLDPIQRKR